MEKEQVRYFNLRKYYRNCKLGDEEEYFYLLDHAQTIEPDFLGEPRILRIGVDKTVYGIYVNEQYISNELPSPLRAGEIKNMLGLEDEDTHFIDNLVWHYRRKPHELSKTKTNMLLQVYNKIPCKKMTRKHIYLLEMVNRENPNCTVRKNIKASKYKDRLDKLADQKNEKETDPNIRYIVWTIEEV